MQGALAEILEGLEPLADGFGTQLEYDLISGPIFSLIDTDKMERAVYNMLSNAMKFAPSGSTIKVKLTRNGNKLYLSVQDSGSGMDPALRSTAFSRYLRSPGIEDSRYGLGLGMLLIRTAATLHGGTVLLEQPENGGFRITMSIEIRKPVDNTLRSPRPAGGLCRRAGPPAAGICGHPARQLLQSRRNQLKSIWPAPFGAGFFLFQVLFQILARVAFLHGSPLPPAFPPLPACRRRRPLRDPGR